MTAEPAPVVPIRGPFPEPGNGPEPMDYHEKSRLRAAAYHATKVYPGPVGRLISHELLSWEDFGKRLGGESAVMQLVEHVLRQPRVDESAA